MTPIAKEEQEHLARLVEESIITLNEVDQRIQALRNGLAAYAPQLALGAPISPRGAPMGPGMAGPGAQGPPMGMVGGAPLQALGLDAIAALQGMHAMGGRMTGAHAPGATSPMGPPRSGTMPPGMTIPGAGTQAWGLWANTPPIAPGGPSPAGPGMGAPGLTGGVDALGRAGLAGGMMGGPGMMPGGAMPRTPPVDVFDKGREFVIQIEVPGVRKEDLEVVANERFVSLRGTTRPEHQPSERVMGERGQATYVRTIPLPVEVQAGKVRAVFRDGVLTVTIPKKDATEGSQRVEITE